MENKQLTEQERMTKCRSIGCNNAHTLVKDGWHICVECAKIKKVCALCGSLFDRKCFTPNESSQDGLLARCKLCRSWIKQGYTVEQIQEHHNEFMDDLQLPCVPWPHCECDICVESVPDPIDPCDCDFCTATGGTGDSSDLPDAIELLQIYRQKDAEPSQFFARSKSLIARQKVKNKLA